MDHLAVKAEQGAEAGIAETDRPLDDGVEHRLDVGRRLTDHAQNLARRRLLLQRLAYLGMGRRERLIFLLQLLEQPHVLDRDHGLVAERL